MMENKAITYLNDIDAQNTDIILKVKILSVWNNEFNSDYKGQKPAYLDANDPYSINMILMDEKDNKMQATCLFKFFKKFKTHLKVDQCLYIQTPSFASNTNNNRIIDNPHKITFRHSTFVQTIKAWAGSDYGFNFADFKSILDQSIPVDSTVDVIGYVEKCRDIESTIFKKGGKKVTVFLQDMEDERLELTLWDSFAEKMSAFMEAEKRKKTETRVFLILQFAKTRSFRGKQTVANGYDGSRIFINNDIEDIISFKSRFLSKSGAVASSSNEPCSSVMITADEDDFLNNIHYTSIAYIEKIQQPKLVVILATIKAICLERIWFYESCTHCKCKVESKRLVVEQEDGSCAYGDGKLYRCDNKLCQGKEISASTSFKIPINVQDGTGTCSLTLFDSDAVQILKKTAIELLTRQEKSIEFEEYPAELDELVGKKYAFIIKISEYSIDNQVQYYAINKLTDDESIIEKLNKKISSEQDTVYTRDDAVTPPSIVPNTTKTPPVDLKRNVKEIYDLEDPTAFLTNKKRINDDCDANDGDGKPMLLVPKVEK